jgi:hypothetical protein
MTSKNARALLWRFCFFIAEYRPLFELGGLLASYKGCGYTCAPNEQSLSEVSLFAL